jgi:rfaE bifunctional protein nucleotidyltransferase chain/domain
MSGIGSSIRAVRGVRNSEVNLRAAAAEIAGRLRAGGRVFTLGNGGSAAQAQHLATELVVRFAADRRALAGTALTCDGVALTAIGNDMGFERVFARQVEALVGPDDVVVGFSTSGESPNVLAAIDAARQLRAITIGIVGRIGCPLAAVADLVITTPGDSTASVQEAHLAVVHVICRLVEDDLLAGREVLGLYPSGAVVDVAEAVRLCRRWRDRGMKVVWTNGCFDLLHAGHVRMLREASQCGEILVLGVNDDASVRRLKGDDRPINSLEHRLTVLAALDCVDLLVPLADDEPTRVLGQLRPDVVCKGGDYASGDRPIPERDVVEAIGGEFLTLGWTEGLSTTTTVRRLRAGVHVAPVGAAP